MMIGLLAGALLACVGVSWAVRTATLAPFILSDATNVVVSAEGLSGTRIDYEAGGLPFEWRDRIAKHLDSEGWQSRDYTFTGTRSPFVLLWYSNTTRLGPITVINHAILGGDPDKPHLAQIKLNHEIHFKWEW
jgi:hypothetical protein